MASCEVFYSPQPRGGKPCVARPGSTPGGPRGDLRAARLRPVSVGRQGWGAWWVALRRQEPCSTGRVVPEAWPAVPSWEEDAHEPQQAMPQAAGGRRRAPLWLLVCKHRPINGLEKKLPLKAGHGADGLGTMRQGAGVAPIGLRQRAGGLGNIADLAGIDHYDGPQPPRAEARPWLPARSAQG